MKAHPLKSSIFDYISYIHVISSRRGKLDAKSKKSYFIGLVLRNLPINFGTMRIRIFFIKKNFFKQMIVQNDTDEKKSYTQACKEYVKWEEILNEDLSRVPNNPIKITLKDDVSNLTFK